MDVSLTLEMAICVLVWIASMKATPDIYFYERIISLDLHAVLDLEFEMWSLKAITDLIYW